MAAERHLTLPRNVVSIVYGPLGPATFGQRYPSKIIDGGTSYARGAWAGSGSGGADEWFTRLGVRFGLFDDFEAGALFLPFELAPQFHFDSVLVFLSQQFRFDALDLAIRFSFQTPGDTGWALAPGVVLATHGRQIALQVGAFMPMEVGSFGEPTAPRVGLNAQLRVILNLVPSFFLTGETGVAYDDLSAPDLLTIPLGFGAGYTLLAGKRLLEFTTSFTWDHWLLPSRPERPGRLSIRRVPRGAGSLDVISSALNTPAAVSGAWLRVCACVDEKNERRSRIQGGTRIDSTAAPWLEGGGTPSREPVLTPLNASAVPTLDGPISGVFRTRRARARATAQSRISIAQGCAGSCGQRWSADALGSTRVLVAPTYR